MLTSISPALQIRVYSDERHQRFADYPETPVRNTDDNFIGADLDLSGVAWYAQDTRRQYTLVSPIHFVGANHFRPSVNGQLRCLATDGTVRTYEIASLSSILNDDGDPTDLFLGTLESVIPESDLVQFHPYLQLGSEGAYTGQPLLFFGHRTTSPRDLRIGSGSIGNFTNLGADALSSNSSFNSTRAFQIVYSNIGLGADDAHAQGGDSGSPSLVEVDGRAAIVGIHSAVANATFNVGLAQPGSIITFDSFIPHYIEELNILMADEGYHMTRSVPGGIVTTGSLTLATDTPETIRAGYPFSLSLSLENSDLNEDANNIKVTSSFPATASGTGSQWVSSQNTSNFTARRGGLPAQMTASDLVIQTTLPSPGSFMADVNFSADEFPNSTRAVQLEVIESFRSWSSDLSDTTFEGDPDLDGIPNLLEYAFGGDPSRNSLQQEQTGQVLLPQISENEGLLTITYLRRKDASLRALDYRVESSPDLSEDSWGVEETDPESVVEVSPSFDLVSQTFSPDILQRFYRLRINLNE